MPKCEGSGLSAALDGKRPAQVPDFAASATLAWRPGERWLFAATLRHTGAAFEDDLETDRLPAATTLDVVVTIPLDHRFTLVLRGENLTGEARSSPATRPGRSTLARRARSGPDCGFPLAAESVTIGCKPRTRRIPMATQLSSAYPQRQLLRCRMGGAAGTGGVLPDFRSSRLVGIDLQPHLGQGSGRGRGVSDQPLWPALFRGLRQQSGQDRHRRQRARWQQISGQQGRVYPACVLPFQGRLGPRDLPHPHHRDDGGVLP